MSRGLRNGTVHRITVLAFFGVLTHKRNVGRAQIGLTIVGHSQSLLDAHLVLRIRLQSMIEIFDKAYPSQPDSELSAVEKPQLVAPIDLEVEDHLPDIHIIVGDV